MLANCQKISPLVRYLDDFVICFQHPSDALKVQAALKDRLAKFALELEPSKTRLLKFGRFAKREAGDNKPATFSFLGVTYYCTCNKEGRFKIGHKTEKKRLHRIHQKVRELVLGMKHEPVKS